MGNKDLADEYGELANEAMKQAEALMGDSPMSDREFLESMSRADRLIDHPDCMTEQGTCGHCMTLWCHAESARRLLAEGDILDGIAKWSDAAREMWEESKYFKLYQEEQRAGRDPHKAFADRGWEM